MTHNPITLQLQSPTGHTALLAQVLSDALRSKEELAIIGVPVYAGRVPNLMIPWLKTLLGHGKQAIAIVTYGGRHYDDALIELVDILNAQGFNVIGAGAFVASHSFDKSLMKTRPNAEDWVEVRKFAAAIKQRQLSLCLTNGSGQPTEPIVNGPHAESVATGGPLDLSILAMGQRPYQPYLIPTNRDGQPIDFKNIKPEVDMARCTRCGICVASCMLGSIPLEAPQTTTGKCTKCNACVQSCPEGARKFSDLGYLDHLDELRSICNEKSPNVWTTG